jgi:hypothetical protein
MKLGGGTQMQYSRKSLTLIAITLLTLGMVGSATAAHSATSELTPDLVDGGTSVDYSLEVTNNEGDSVYRVQVSAPGELTIDTSTVSCPTDWSIDSSSESSFTCYTDAFGSNTIDSGDSLSGFDFSASSTTADGSYTVDVTTTDNNNADTDSSSDTVEVDNTEPESDAVVTDVSGETNDGTWNIEAKNVEDPTTSSVSSGVETVTLQVNTPNSDWKNVETVDYSGSRVSFSDYSPSEGDGDYQFRTVATDGVGNTESVTGSDTSITYDTTDPSVSITSPTGEVYRQSDETLDVSFDYDEQNPSSAEVSVGSNSETTSTLDAGTGKSDTLNFESLPSEDGTYDVTVSLEDEATNQGSDTVTETVVVDDQEPTLDSAITGDSTDGDSTARDKVTLTFTEIGSGIDSATVDASDFTLSTGQEVTDATLNGETVTLKLGSELPRDATPDVTVAADGIADMAGNQVSETTVTASDGLSPQNPSDITFEQDSVNRDTQTSINVDVDFSSAPESGTVTLRIDDSDNEDGDAVTRTADPSQTTNFDPIDLSGLEDGTLTATATISDDDGNVNSDGFTASQTIQKDTTDPVLQNAQKVDDTEFTFDVYDEGNGLDASTVEKTDFTIQESGYSASSFSVGTCEDNEASCTVTVTLSEPIDQDTLTVGFADGGQVSDVEGNTQSSDTVEVSGMDGVAPTLDSASRFDDTTIDVTLSDSGVGLDESSVDSGDFSLTSGSISDIQTGFSDGDNTGTVTINLDSAVDSTSVDVNLQSDGVSDQNSNTQTSGSATAENMDGVAPSISNPTIEGEVPLSDGDKVTVYATVTDEGAGVDTVTADMSDFNGNSDVTLTSETEAGKDFDGNGESSDVYGAEITLDENSASEGEQSATVEATDSANDPNTRAEDTNSLEVDTTYPDVTSATISDSPISDSEADQQTVTVEFSEAMDTTVSPTVEINGIDQAPLSVSADGGFDSEGNTWTGAVTINDNNEDTTATIDVTGAQDQAGNSLGDVNDNTFQVDTENPRAPSSLDYDVDYVNIDNQGSVGYTVNFDNDVEKGTLYVTATGPDGETASDDVSLEGGETSTTGTLDLSTFSDGSVDIEAYMEDEYGNDGSATSNTGAAEKDTQRPTSPQSATASTIYEDNVEGYSVDVEFGSTPESGFVELRLAGPGDGSTTRGQSVSPQSSIITLDQLSTDHLEDGTVTILARYKDDAGNYDTSDGSFTEIGTVEKDTDNPGLESATTEDKKMISVDFDEAIADSTADPIDFNVEGQEMADYGTIAVDGSNGDMSAEYAETEEGTPGIRAYGQTPDSGDRLDSGYAGVSFQLDNPVTFDGSNSLAVEYVEGQDDEDISPDWIAYVVEAESTSGDVAAGSRYIVFDSQVAMNSGQEFSWNEDVTPSSNDRHNFGSDYGAIAYKKGDFSTQVTPSNLVGNSDIQEVRVLTGSGGDDSDYVALTYTGVEFNGNELMTSFVENGEDTVNLHLAEELATDETPTVEVVGDVTDLAGNSLEATDSPPPSVTPSDGISPEVTGVETFDSAHVDGNVDGVTVDFTEEIQNADADSFSVTDSSITVNTVSEDGSSVDVTFSEPVDGTSVTPEVTVDQGAVEDTSGNSVESTTTDSKDGAAPVLLDSEVNQDSSDSSQTVLDLSFSESVNTESDATAVFENAPGQLQFDGSSGQTVTASYDDGGAAVLNTGPVHDGEAPAVESFTGVTDGSANGAVTTGTEVKTFTRNLESGLNMVSFPINEGTMDYAKVSQQLENLDSVWYYDSSTNSWETVDSEFRGGAGYIFSMSQSEELSVSVDHEYTLEGDASAPEEFSLSPGWNLVGHYQEFDQPESEALSSISDSYDEVYDGDLNTVSELETGHAYWVTRNDDNTYTP